MTLAMILGWLQGNPALVQYLVFFGAGAAGIVAHWFKKWSRHEIAGSLWRYLFIDDVRGTVYAFVSLLAAEATAFATGAVSAGTNLPLLVGAAFLAGYHIDNITDKARPQ